MAATQFLFPQSRVSPGALKFRLALVGALGGLVFALVAGTLGLQAVGVLGSGTRVTVNLPTIGDTLGINSDVKFRGLRVGRVIEVDPGADTGEPTAQVIVEDEHAQLIPATVRARVLPGTLFGNEYVDLVTTAGGSPASPTTAAAGEHLRDEQVVEADTSKSTLRLMATLEATQRLLVSADPSQWDAALSQFADALEARGDDLAQFVHDANQFLVRWEKQQPQVMTDLRLLAQNADLLADVEPQVISALRDSRPLIRMIAGHEDQLRSLWRGTTTVIEGENGAISFIVEEGPNASRVLQAADPTLRAFAARSASFRQLLAKTPGLLVNGANAVEDGQIQMEGVIAPQPLDPYDAEDCPRYRGLPGPNCPDGGDR